MSDREIGHREFWLLVYAVLYWRVWRPLKRRVTSVLRASGEDSRQ